MSEPTIRYRTESFGGEEYRDAAEVMAYETSVLGNSDILEYLSDTLLSGRLIEEDMRSLGRELDEYGFIDDMSLDEMQVFFRNVLQENKYSFTQRRTIHAESEYCSAK